jgi:TRAP-type C4-dicarboxylate transport system substrate-binding protein
MRRRFASGLLLAAVSLCGSLTAGSASAASKLKVGTAAAPESPWGSVFKTWRKAVEQKTSNAVSFDFFFNSTQGSEVTMVDKMKAGQLDGAAVTSVGLGKLDKRLLAMEMPGIIRSWKTADAVRDALATDFEKMLSDKKVSLVAWGDVGLAHYVSNGFTVRVPDDLKGRSPWVGPDDPINKAVYSKIGGINPHPADIMSVLPDIDNGKINCMETAALAAEMLQWNAKFDHGVDAIDGIVVGAVILSTEALDKLPADGKAAVLDTGKAMGSSSTGLKQKIRAEDGAAWDRFKTRSGVQITKLTSDETTKWDAVFKGARDALKAGTFDPTFVTKLETTAAANP